MNENDSKQTTKKAIFSKKSIPYLLLLPAFLFYAVFWLLPVLWLAAAEPELLFVPPHPASTSAAASTSAVRRLCFMVVLLYSQS